MKSTNHALNLENQNQSLIKSQEHRNENMESHMKKTETQSTASSVQKNHVQKVQPAGGTQTVSDPGGCRPTGL